VAQEEAPDDVLALPRQQYATLKANLDAERDKRTAAAVDLCRRELTTLQQNIQAQGNLDYVLAIRTELERLEKDPVPPDAPAPEAFAHLRRVQYGFRTSYRETQKAYETAVARLDQQYIITLRQIERRMVAENRIDDAVKVRQEIEAKTVWEETRTIPGLGIDFVLAMPGSVGQSCISAGHKCDREARMTLKTPYWVSTHEVTQAQFEKVMERNPSYHKGEDLPVETVSWYDAMEFCQKLTEVEDKAGRLPDGYVYRLPTEAEWEWAARGAHRGTGEAYAMDTEYAAIRENSGAKGGENSHGDTRPVGQLKPNALGVYDMVGNVMEWCLDNFVPCLAEAKGIEEPDPLIQTKSVFRPLRGGACTTSREHLGSLRYGLDPATDFRRDVGFRIVLAPERKIEWERQKGGFSGTYTDSNGKVMVVLTPDGKWTSPASGWSIKDSHGGTWEFHRATKDGRFDLATIMLRYYRNGQSIRTYNTWEALGYRKIRKLGHDSPWVRQD
jgi:hypothetical protein